MIRTLHGLSLSLLAAALMTSTPSHADIAFSYVEVGGDVTMTSSGVLDTTKLLTVPHGEKHHMGPAERVYDDHSLESLVFGWRVNHMAYAMRGADGSLTTTLDVRATPQCRKEIAMLELAKPEPQPENRSLEY